MACSFCCGLPPAGQALLFRKRLLYPREGYQYASQELCWWRPEVKGKTSCPVNSALLLQYRLPEPVLKKGARSAAAILHREHIVATDLKPPDFLGIKSSSRQWHSEGPTPSQATLASMWPSELRTSSGANCRSHKATRQTPVEVELLNWARALRTWRTSNNAYSC